MSATTMHFGPEWMRTKHQPLLRSQPPPSPPPQANLSNSTYSALVSSTPSVLIEKPDEAHPFRYSKDELLKIYQESAGKGGLGLEVERWEGVVREIGSEPVALREMTDTERKLFGGSLNSDVRRRPSQSTDYLTPLNTSTLERSRLAHNPPSTASSPLRDRFGASLKRRDSAASSPDPAALAVSRNPSLPTLQTPVISSRETARPRVGYTPSFDGVLNNGESWIARRRASEASLKLGNTLGRDVLEGQQVSKVSGIHEEREDGSGQKLEVTIEDQSPYLSSSPHVLSEEPHQFLLATDVHEPLTQGSQLPRKESPSATLYVHECTSPPAGLLDLSAIEWSYKDPTGQIQGPFRADIMQKWYNDGYFSADLPMKRTHYDSHWTTVGELVKQSNGENIFLCPLINAVPPGLSRTNGSPLQTYPQAEQLFNEPYQPAPVRSLRASTLESYLVAGLVPSASPSSSTGVSHSSPDPSTFGTNKNFSSDVCINGRSTGSGVQEYFTPFTEKRTSYDYSSDLNGTQLPSFGNFGPERDLNINDYGCNNAYATHDSWKIPLTLNAGFPDHQSRPVTSSNLGSSADTEHRQDLADTNDSIVATNVFSQGTVYVSPDISYQQQSEYIQSGHPPSDSFGTSIHDYEDVVLSTATRDHDEALQSAAVPGLWGNVSDTLTSRRSGVRDVGLLTPASVAALPNLTAQSSWPRIDEAPSTNSQLIGNTLNNPDGLSDIARKVEHRPSNLTTELTGQRKDEEKNAEVGNAPITSLSSTGYNQVPEQFLLDASMRTLRIKTPNTIVSQPSPVNQPSIISQSSIINQHNSVEPLPTPKVAWTKEEDTTKKKASGVSVSLREIQEAEVKKLESRKALEREKERSRVTTEFKEDIQPFTASWGLPSSQAGSRNNSLPIREIPPMPASSPTTAVWTAPSLKQPTIKRTMKEIQEEEEKHKKQISKEAKEAIAAASAKRAYADSTAKFAPTSPPSSNNGVWTTVGANGKLSAAPVPPPSRPPIQPSTSFSTASLSASTSRASDSSAQKVPNPILKLRPTPPKQEDIIYSPSHEFLKWLSDSLKGLNSSVNVEEIISMLLSFPLDLDTSTIEIISDTIYSNSTTLDGRRFASEFVSKRKADANAGSKTSTISAQSSVKPVSIADVVKATPKAAQAEWGFKVVNKKKKSNRTN